MQQAAAIRSTALEAGPGAGSPRGEVDGSACPCPDVDAEVGEEEVSEEVRLC